MSDELVVDDNNTGPNATQLSFPCGIYFDLFSNYLFIANSFVHNIIRWTAEASSGVVVPGDSVNRLPDNKSTLLLGPIDMTLDSMGNIHADDGRNHRIQFFP